MKHIAGWKVAILLSLFVTAPIRAIAQDAQLATPPSSSTADQQTKDDMDLEQLTEIRVRSNLVVTPVTVIGSEGQFLYGLSRNDFVILDNGVPQHITGFESESRRVAVVIVVQTTRAVEAYLKGVVELQPILSSLLLGTEGEAAVLTFNDRIRLAQDFSPDSDKLLATLDNLKPEGLDARLNDALLRAIALLERRPKEDRKIVVVFSTGYDEGSQSNKEVVVRRATGSEVTIYGMGFNPVKSMFGRKPEAPPPTHIDRSVAVPAIPGTVATPSLSTNIYQAPIPAVDILDSAWQLVRTTLLTNPMEYYAGYTGGVYYYTRVKKDRLENQLAQIAAEVHNQYELTFVPEESGKPGFHKIEVKVNRAGAKVRARAGYFYQPALPPSPGPASSQPGSTAPQN